MTRKKGSTVSVRGGKPTRRTGLFPTVEALHRSVNRAILRDRYGVFARAGVKPLVPRVLVQGPTYRKAGTS